MKLIDDWFAHLNRMWSIRISLFFGVLTGVAMGLSAFVDVFNPWFFMGASVVVNVVLIPIARLVKQKDEAQ